MPNKNQKAAFLSYEADAWFQRNKSVIDNYSAQDDKVLNLIKKYNLDPTAVLEIGSSAGYRLNAIKQVFPKAVVNGLEPSKEAIKYGQENYRKVNFVNGTADDLPAFPDDSIDVLIVGFVFYVIDRSVIFKVISELDRVLKNGGMLIIIDFFSEKALKNAYEHIKDFSAYSFKQNYDEIFTASKLYLLLDKSTFSHSTKELDASENYYDKYSIALLKKDINASYK